MTLHVRNDAWNSNGDFSNQDLLWYAKGVGKMMSRSLDDPASWWFFAAMHGEYVDPGTPWYPQNGSFPAWGAIQGPPSVPTAPMPDASVKSVYWNQCQHGSWYFAPWHRGYLLAIEAQLRTDIVSLGGPDSWALPYWNYFGGDNGAQGQMPPALSSKTLPDGSPNPLFVSMRYGPDGNGNIYVPTDLWQAAHPADPRLQAVTAKCLENTLYTGSNPQTPAPGFGGPDTGFSHSGEHGGNLESNPHNFVHGYVGGQTPVVYGLMADPGLAALDPVFYLHHCNIDRMWASWNDSGNVNPRVTKWLAGPPRKFVVPMPNKEHWVFTPQDVNILADLNYGYQSLSQQGKPVTPRLVRRLMRLNVPGAQDLSLSVALAQPAGAPSLVGATKDRIRIVGSGTGPVQLRMDVQENRSMVQSIEMATLSNLPDQVYLKLENIRGTLDATVLSVFINLPESPSVESLRAHHAGDVSLFGLRRASVTESEHAGQGLTALLDVSHVMDDLQNRQELTGDQIQVSLRPNNALPPGKEINVDRVSLIRQAL